MQVKSVSENKVAFEDPAEVIKIAEKAKVEELKTKKGSLTLADIMDMLLLVYEKLQVK